MAGQGSPVDRAGGGVVVEVYPAASLRIWRLPHQGYKGTKGHQTREHLIARLLTAAPWLNLGDYTDLCARSDDALDAVVAALTARAHALGRTSAPAEGPQREQAQREGWIVFPIAPLATLVT